MIRVKDVRKSFGEKTVLKDINMNFEPGKCNMLIGASGSGKTVLMNIISGLVAKVTILYDGRSSYHENNYLNRKILISRFEKQHNG